MSLPPGDYVGTIERIDRSGMVEVEITGFSSPRPVFLRFWQGFQNFGELWMLEKITWPFPTFTPKARVYDWGFDGL